MVKLVPRVGAGYCQEHAVSIADISINNSMRWSERESVCMLSMTNNCRSNKERCEMRMGEWVRGPESEARESERIRRVGWESENIRRKEWQKSTRTNRKRELFLKKFFGSYYNLLTRTRLGLFARVQACMHAPTQTHTCVCIHVYVWEVMFAIVIENDLLPPRLFDVPANNLSRE